MQGKPPPICAFGVLGSAEQLTDEEIMEIVPPRSSLPEALWAQGRGEPVGERDPSRIRAPTKEANATVATSIGRFCKPVKAGATGRLSWAAGEF